MAMMRYSSATIVEPNIKNEDWNKVVCCGHKGKCVCGDKGCRTKVAKTILAKYSPEKYLLSHATIVAAVDTEEAKESKSKYKNYLIKPAYSKLVNNNGDAWTKELLAATYKTFIGCNNFLEHVQIPSLSKGKVIDAILREVPIGKDAAGKDQTTYYVDILVATERKHKDLVARIESGKLRTLSMGCKIAFSICSKCGNLAKDETEACQHVKYEKNNTFYDESGVQRKVAELCGHVDEAESVSFVDASWVENPAFTGAVVRNIVNPSEDIMAKIDAASKKEDFEAKEGDYLKAAKEKTAAPAEEPPAEDPPAEDPPAEDPPAEDPPVEEPPAEDLPADAPEPVPEPENLETDYKKWKKDVKEKILKEIGKELTKEFKEKEEERPNELETLDESLIQPTASVALKQMWKMKRNWDNYLQKTAGNLDKKKFEKLKFGTYMLLTSSDLTTLVDYGYSRRDFLAVMSCLDQCFRKPLAKEIIKALSEIDSIEGLNRDEAVFAMTKLAGRKLTAEEIKKSLMWLKLMASY